jgi:prolyl-tRNA synthetase
MLGTKYSQALNATFIDEQGKEKFFIMGSYGVGITRTAQAAVEKFHDDLGIIWPVPIAPFLVEIVPVNILDEKQREAAFEIYHKMKEKNFEVLLDDRNERAGVKFNDADLIGIPLRITIGERSLKEDKVEVQVRGSQAQVLIRKNEVLDGFLKILSEVGSSGKE